MDVSFSSTLYEEAPPPALNTFSDVQDDLSWVMHHIQSLGLKCEESDITPAMVQILHSLFSERNHFQSQTQNLSQLSSELKGKNTNLEKQCDSQKNEIVMLKQDLNVANERNSALRSEHREVKGQWLNEKSELESRHFQTMALNTQIQGTLRKKERDYDKLQGQLSKISSKNSSSSTTRGAKSTSSSSASITISKPLQRNSSQQGNPSEGTLQMAEVAAAKATIASLESENENLREAVEDLTQNFEEFQANLAKKTLEATRLAEERKDSLVAMATPPKRRNSAEDKEENEEQELAEDSFEQLSTLEQAKYVERRLDAVNETLSAATSANLASTPSKFHTPGRSQSRLSMIGSASKRAGNAISGTTTARPFNWIVKQANSEVKALRERAEKLNWNIHPSTLDAVLAENTPSKTYQDKENETPRKAQLKRNEKALKETLFDYRVQLEEACAVICEQDRLIHAALIGRHGALAQSNYVEEDEEEDGGNTFDESESGAGTLTPSSKLALGSSYDISDWSVENFLPSVSPDTMAVLQAADFSTLPPPVSLSMAQEEEE